MICKYCKEEIERLRFIETGVILYGEVHYRLGGLDFESDVERGGIIEGFTCPECDQTIATSYEEACKFFEAASSPEPRSESLPERHSQQLKGGVCDMETIQEKTATMCPTKTGNGFKIVLEGVWYYASKQAVLDVVNKGAKCVFKTITDAPARAPTDDEY